MIMNEWQPIETAPRTGHQVLLLSEKRTVEIGHWVSGRSAWGLGGGNFWTEAIAKFWHPLPVLPPPRQPAPAPGGTE